LRGHEIALGSCSMPTQSRGHGTQQSAIRNLQFSGR
jgi:hypothetical protein